MIVVTGATGSIGRALVSRLRESGADVLALVRRPEQGEALGVEYAVGDFERPSSVPMGERLFLNTAPWPNFARRHKEVIDRAAAAGVSQVVSVSVLGARPGAPLSGGPHGEADAHLRASGLPHTILQPVGFMQSLPGEVADGRFHGSYGTGRTGYIDTRDIADVAFALLTAPVGESATHVLTGPEALTQQEVAAQLSAALGRTVTYVDLSIEEMTEHARRRWGLPEATARELAEMMAAVPDSDWSKTTGTVADLAGHPPRSLADYLADHAADFAG
ncbi:NAD(P)H-binding protein [Nonomuraea sp. NPDC003804]|uniref:NAD(P)H-binding protein n=1 Tax=Nonomuraea sp. NPDC003804 TaxID=3154547 RepID=UPI0033B3E43C